MNLLELWARRDEIDARITNLADGCAEHAEGRERQDLLLEAIDERAKVSREIQRAYNALPLGH